VAFPYEVNQNVHPSVSSNVLYFFLKVFCFVVNRMEYVLIANKPVQRLEFLFGGGRCEDVLPVRGIVKCELAFYQWPTLKVTLQAAMPQSQHLKYFEIMSRYFVCRELTACSRVDENCFTFLQMGDSHESLEC
jgi:hypothetical protein